MKAISPLAFLPFLAFLAFFALNASLGCATPSATATATATTTTTPATRLVHLWREGRDGARPRCLETASGLNVFLRWNDADRYARTVEATRDDRSCASWRTVVRERQQGWVVIHDDDRTIFGTPLSAELVADLAAIRDGANVVDGATVDQVATDIIARGGFTLEDNIALTDRYGHGFVGSVYQKTVFAERKNAWAFEVLERDMARTVALGEAAALQEMQAKSQNLVVMVSMGAGWSHIVDEHTVPYVKDFIETVKSIGVEVDVLERDTFGDVEENAVHLQKKVEAYLDAGKDLVLFGLCKGTPELFAAAARATASSLDEAGAQTRRSAGRGRVVGAINMSGMMSGLVFGDWLAPYETPLALSGAVLSAVPLRSAREVGSYMKMVPQLTTPRIEAFTKTFVTKLPKDAVYIDVVGVVPDDGLLKRDIGAMGPFINTDRERDLAKASNDGFLRYPGNELPRGVAVRHYVVVMSGSHMLFDGAFGPWSMESLDNQRALFRAAVRFVVDAPLPPAALTAGR
jgi:hypothetical protein